MNIQAILFGFGGISAFTLVAVGAFNKDTEIILIGVSILTYIFGEYRSTLTSKLKNTLKGNK